MSHDAETIVRPKPRRPFDLADSPSDATSSEATTPSGELREDAGMAMEAPSFSRTRSILNLTSSTLFGIYSPTAYSAEGSKDESSTPWGTRPVTPSGVRSHMKGLGIGDSNGDDARTIAGGGASLHPQNQRSRHPRPRPFYHYREIAKLGIVSLLGAGFGELISFLHVADDGQPIGLSGSTRHLASWSVMAVAFALLLPRLDRAWIGDDDPDDPRPGSRGRWSKVDKAVSGKWSTPEWINAVRVIGAFIGLSFAIRKIPWQSELQQSATLALVNPAVWYVVDRTIPGLVLATTTALAGSSLLLSTGAQGAPGLIPSPRQLGPQSSRPNLTSAHSTPGHSSRPVEADQPGVHVDAWAVAIWTASVLFVMSVSFGNIGRRL